MNYAIISNKGEVEIQAFTKVGLSSKRDDNSKIGKFGSGTKFSIAYLLRNKIQFRIFSGVNEFLFTTMTATFRDNVYEEILANGELTGMTTGMGPDWQFWFCLREFYCNAIDEGEADIQFFDTDLLGEFNIEGKEGKTIICIPIPSDFDMNQWDSLFSEHRRPLYVGVSTTNAAYSIFSRLNTESAIMYYKGIRCMSMTDKKNALFDYDSNGFGINESRVLDGDWTMHYQIAKILSSVNDEFIINTIFKNCKYNNIEADVIGGDYFEITADSYWAKYVQNNEIVVEEVAGRFQDESKFHTYVQIPLKICKKINKVLPDKYIRGMMHKSRTNTNILPIDESEVPKRLTFLVQQAVKDMAEQWNYHIKFPIQYFDEPVVKKGSTVTKTFGNADTDNKIIQLNICLQEYGKKEIALTLIEEQEHLLSMLSDETRGLQDHLFRKIIFLMEEHSGFFF